MNENQRIVKETASTITTGVVSSGLLQPYQAKKFLQQTFDATPLMGAVRHEIRAEKSGELDKIGRFIYIIRIREISDLHLLKNLK